MFASFLGSMNTGYFYTRLWLFFSSGREAVIGLSENVDSLLQKILCSGGDASEPMHYSYLLGLSKGCDFRVSKWNHTYYSLYNVSLAIQVHAQLECLEISPLPVYVGVCTCAHNCTLLGMALTACDKATSTAKVTSLAVR